MTGFLSSIAAEMGARRRRLRESMGDRGQALSEFALLGGLLIGSLGLFLRPWMAAAAPWGFALPLVFVIGFLLIDWRRQAAMKAAGEGEAPERVAARYDWTHVLWGVFCALAGAAAFIIAWGAEPAPPPTEEGWTPPESSVSVDISP